MRFLRLINNGIKLLPNMVRWLNYAWVDAYAYRYMRKLYVTIYKICLVAFYILLGLSLFIGLIFSMMGNPLLAAFLLLVMFLCLPLLAIVINVKMVDDEN